MSEDAAPRFPRRAGRRKTTGKRSPVPAGSSLRVATYTRISTDEVNQPYSLEAQADHLNRFLALRPEWSKVAEYTDQMSGSKLERPSLQRLLADIRAGKVDVVLVYRVDRLSRNMRHLQALIEVFEENQVSFTSATEPFDTSNSMGRMILNILGVFAEFERSSLIDRIRAGNAAKAARGEWVGGLAPFGYEVAAGKTLAVVESEATVVREIYRLFLDQNLGGLNIAKVINTAGHRTRNGRHWTADKVLDILRRPTYAGWIVHHDEAYPGLHPAIVDPATFEKVQVLLEQRGSAGQRRSDAADYKLAGLLRCTNCGGALVGERAKGQGGEYRYYVCRRRKLTSGVACASKRINADVLEIAVLETLIRVYRDYGLFSQAAEQAITAREAALPDTLARLATVEAELRRVQASIDRYLSAFEQGTMDAEVCQPRLRDLGAQLDDLSLSRNELRLIVDSPEPVMPSQVDVTSLADSLERRMRECTGADLKGLLKHLVDHIDVSPDAQVTPYLRVPHVGPVQLTQLALAPVSADVAPVKPVAVAVPGTTERLWKAGRIRDLVLQTMNDLEAEGRGPEFPVRELIAAVQHRQPDLKGDTVWRIINKDLCKPRLGQAHPDLVKPRRGVVRRRVT